MANKNLTAIFFVASIILCILVAAITLYTGCRYKLIEMEEFTSPACIFSILLFLFLTYCVVIDVRLVYLILPFVFIAFPSIINNLFPGVLLSPSIDAGNAAYPIITHVDIFLIILLIRYTIAHRTLKLAPSFIITIAIFLFIVSSFIAILVAPTAHHIVVLGVCTYPVRLLILLQLTLSNYVVRENDIDSIVKSLMFSILFLFFESLIYTIATQSSVLRSGTLEINSFGNIVGQISVFLILFYLFWKPQSPRLRFFAIILIGLSIMVLSNTRMALLAFFLNIILFTFARFAMGKKVLIGVILIIASSIILKFTDQEKYSINNIAEHVKVHTDKIHTLDLTQIIDADRTPATSSIRTRMSLYQTSLNMFYDHPLRGVGYGNFNLMKSHYGFKDNVLIDSHNGYLFLLSQLGIIGFFWIYLIYLKPFFLYRKHKNNPLFSLAIINTGIAICDITNAGIFKIQILALLLFNSLILIHYCKNLKKAEMFEQCQT
jgi:O-antigen ligase